MSAEAVLERINMLSGDVPLLVSLSGGNPAIQDFAGLIRIGHTAGHRFALETQGSICRDWFAALNNLVLSPKPPSSGMQTDWAALEDCLRAAGDGPEIALKIVVFNEEDYAYARGVGARYPHVPLYLQPGNHTPPPPEADDAPIDIEGVMERMRWLVNKLAEDRWFTPRVLPQLHVLLWGNKRGV